jgi:hypothetical protein
MKNLNKRETHTDPFSDFKSVLSLGVTIRIDLRLILHITNTQAHETIFINIFLISTQLLLKHMNIHCEK